MLRHVLFYLLISSLSTLRFGPRWAKVPWTFSASQPPLNPSRPCQVSHSHNASLRGVWTINIPSQLYYHFPTKSNLDDTIHKYHLANMHLLLYLFQMNNNLHPLMNPKLIQNNSRLLII